MLRYPGQLYEEFGLQLGAGLRKPLVARNSLTISSQQNAVPDRVNKLGACNRVTFSGASEEAPMPICGFEVSLCWQAN